MVRFHRGLDGLSEQQKRCLFLRMEGLRYPEIGAALGISASAVGSSFAAPWLDCERPTRGGAR